MVGNSYTRDKSTPLPAFIHLGPNNWKTKITNSISWHMKIIWDTNFGVHKYSRTGTKPQPFICVLDACMVQEQNWVDATETVEPIKPIYFLVLYKVRCPLTWGTDTGSQTAAEFSSRCLPLAQVLPSPLYAPMDNEAFMRVKQMYKVLRRGSGAY